MKTSADVLEYNASQIAEHEAICIALAKLFSKSLPAAESKVWHGHPVWFIESNPIVGYSIKKSGVQVLFWSGQSFKAEGLKPIGKFKAAAFDVETVDTKTKALLNTWLIEAEKIQWDYANVVKKRSLEKLTKF
jgi:hypothetical protein